MYSVASLDNKPIALDLESSYWDTYPRLRNYLGGAVVGKVLSLPIIVDDGAVLRTLFPKGYSASINSTTQHLVGSVHRDGENQFKIFGFKENLIVKLDNKIEVIILSMASIGSHCYLKVGSISGETKFEGVCTLHENDCVETEGLRPDVVELLYFMNTTEESLMVGSILHEYQLILDYVSRYVSSDRCEVNRVFGELVLLNISSTGPESYFEFVASKLYMFLQIINKAVIELIEESLK